MSSIVTRLSGVTKPAAVMTFLDENQYTIEDGVYLCFFRRRTPGKTRPPTGTTRA